VLISEFDDQSQVDAFTRHAGKANVLFASDPMLPRAVLVVKPEGQLALKRAKEQQLL
jgi:hypothetical protein